MSGSVYLEHFDKGIQTTLGWDLFKEVQVKVDGGTRTEYAIDCAKFGLTGPKEFGGAVPIFFVVGNSAYTSKFFPCVIVRRVSLKPAFENGGAYYHVDYRKPGKGAEPISVTLNAGTDAERVVTGYRRYEMKERATPYNIEYEVMLRTRGDRAMSDAAKLHRAIMRVCLPPGFAMLLQDSLGDDRTYDVLVDDVSPNLDVLDLTERDTGWTISLTIHGELDHQEPYEVSAVTAVPSTTITRE